MRADSVPVLNADPQRIVHTAAPVLNTCPSPPQLAVACTTPRPCNRVAGTLSAGNATCLVWPSSSIAPVRLVVHASRLLSSHEFPGVFRNSAAGSPARRCLDDQTVGVLAVLSEYFIGKRWQRRIDGEAARSRRAVRLPEGHCGDELPVIRHVGRELLCLIGGQNDTARINSLEIDQCLLKSGSAEISRCTRASPSADADAAR